MDIAENNNEIHLSLKSLIEQKTIRDQAVFTLYQLAKAIEMPYSILAKLVHNDPNKRVNNPRIETLYRIVNFFRQDGFDITIDDLLSGFKRKNAVNAKVQETGLFSVEKTLSIYSFDADKPKKLGTVDIKLKNDSESLIALLSEEEIKPIFKRHSIFIIDAAMKPEHDMLLAVKIDGCQKILIRKLCIAGSEKMLQSYNEHEPNIFLSSDMHHHILGVVIQINAAT